MTSEPIRSALTGLLQEIAPDVDPALLDPEADLRSAADLDSMDFLNLVQAVADTFGVEIPEVDYPQVRSLHGLLDYIESRAPVTTTDWTPTD